MKTSRSPRFSRFVHALTVVAAVFAAAVSSPTAAEQKAPTTQPARPSYPDAFFKAVPGSDRLRNPDYFKLLAGDGLRQVDSQVLFTRISAAAAAGDNYKALYLARVFTQIEPGNAAGWRNRAKLASTLGFMQEAAASVANTQSNQPSPVRGEALPGSIKVRPASLADWAAAIALVADDVNAREGSVAIAVRDDLSGVSVASEQEIEIEQRGPWATAQPVRLDDILPNLFVMPQATPMDKKSMRGGMFALGALAMATSSYATTIGAADSAAQFAQLYGNAMAKAFEVPSELKGGSYIATTYVGGASKRATVAPKTAGKYEAVGTPLPLLWATGPSMTPAVNASWRNGDSDKTVAMKLDAKTKKQEWKKYSVPALTYPRLQQLCNDQKQCSWQVTAFEVMLSSDDVHAFAPGLESSLPDLTAWRARYSQGQVITAANAGSQFVGFDASGAVYVTRQKPTEWLTVNAAPPPTRK